VTRGDGDQQSSEIEVAFGRRLRDLRLQSRLSQAQLAALVSDRGVAWHQTTVAKTEAGTRSIRLAELAAVADALGLDLTVLLPPHAPGLTIDEDARQADEWLDQIESVAFDLEDVLHAAEVELKHAADASALANTAYRDAVNAQRHAAVQEDRAAREVFRVQHQLKELMTHAQIQLQKSSSADALLSRLIKREPISASLQELLRKIAGGAASRPRAD